MSLNPELLEYLICPDCKSDQLTFSESDQIITCRSCLNKYPVIDGIPVMIAPKKEVSDAE